MQYVWDSGVVWWGDVRVGDLLQDSCVNERIILKWIFKKLVGDMD
jgi:hypothetical protein